MKVFGICGKSNEGRSELVSELVARFRLEGLRVAIVKRAPISFDMDTPGTDSHRQRQSGCSQMVIASDRRMTLMEEYPADSAAPGIWELLARLKPADIVLVINFREDAIPRLEVESAPERQGDAHRAGRGIVVRAGPTRSAECRFAVDDFDDIIDFILRHSVIWGERRPEPRVARGLSA